MMLKVDKILVFFEFNLVGVLSLVVFFANSLVVGVYMWDLGFCLLVQLSVNTTQPMLMFGFLVDIRIKTIVSYT